MGKGGGGRVDQKERTRAAIVAAARELVDGGGDVTMPAVASAARVSEATAYRYFPDLASLVGELESRIDADAVMAAVADSPDPVARIGHVAEALARQAAQRQGALRALVAATIGRPRAGSRPGNRFPLIERALAPWSAAADPAAVAQLTRDLAVVISPEALFTLLDQCGMSTEDAVASLTSTARTLTEAAVTRA